MAGTMSSPNDFPRSGDGATPRTAGGPKSFRKAVATLAATVAGDKVAGDQFGHVKGSTVTRKNCIKRRRLGPNVREVPEQFASDPALTQRIAQ